MFLTSCLCALVVSKMHVTLDLIRSAGYNVFRCLIRLSREQVNNFVNEFMQLIDITPSYVKYVIRQDKPEFYEASLPQLFAHYQRFWAPPGEYFYREEDEILRRRELIGSRLAFLEERFSSQGLGLEAVVVVLFVGQGTSNGHAFPMDEKWVVWLPVESYPTPLCVDVFVAHELAHAEHYQRQPEFFFETEAQKTNVFRQVVTEGIATLTSRQVLDIDEQQALWADYLPDDQIQRWYAECVRRESELLANVARKLESSDEDLFSYRGGEDVLKNRGGYYAALRIIQRILDQNRLALSELFTIDKQGFLRMITASLAPYAVG